MGAFSKRSSGSDEHVEHIDSNGHGKPKRQRGCKGFCKKWWWVILIVVLLIIMVVLLLIFFVAIPKIIQNKVNGAELHVDSIRVFDTKEDTVMIAFDSWVDADDSISATIDSFEASMYLEDKLPHTPFAVQTMPETKTGLSIVNITSMLETKGERAQAFADFNAWMMTNETVRLGVSGRTKVRAKGLKAHEVDFKKVVELKGLNGFKGLEVTESEVDLAAKSGQDNFKGAAIIPNPSVLSLELGNVTFVNFLDGVELGKLHIDNFNLVPGPNAVNIRAEISQAPVLGALGKKPACETGIVEFEMLGDSVVNNGENLTYFADALKVQSQFVPLNIAEALPPGLGDAVLKCPSS